MRLRLAIGSFLTVFSVSAMTENHSKAGGINHSATERQIEAYSSAAPAYIGKHATVIGVSGRVLREGTNGWT